MSTTSSTDSNMSSSRLEIVSATPSCKTQRESVEIAPGNFSKPRVNKRSRRDTQDSSRSEGDKEFKYYGRHANQWLFNDFSVTHAVSKGFKRFFGKDNGGDWYENRER
ncbi:uncharacterized protein K460DRAFT_349986 [Cucurbitaria berberidis CBS 394.84]|uniref:Uncharacterized protein n=1 Tax=Cucurbitaria berberidis CBS 394.84 TaxID=1168544 RepID=A0A9P4GR42_9PLEO|nr:uncharacterized protein K460DRAFT_349986 [Cucurbitaria berberidis CBS 394.84]KAF1849841.1 hypothetical protein K460DRAFT_349986 [Cucurbitaria berberidis CBS 394.84]